MWYQDTQNVYGYQVGVNIQGVVSLYNIYQEKNNGQINAQVANMNSKIISINTSKIDSTNNTKPDIINIPSANSTKTVAENNTNIDITNRSKSVLGVDTITPEAN